MCAVNVAVFPGYAGIKSKPLSAFFLGVDKARNDGLTNGISLTYANHIHITPDRQPCQHSICLHRTHALSGA